MKRAMTQEAKDARACEILDAAEKMLLTTDYKDLKMSKIAKAAGISSGLIFTYFKTKETLFLSLLWREFEKRVDYLEKVIAESRPAGFDGIRRLVLAELEHVLYESPVYIKLEPMRSSILEKNVDPEFLAAMQQKLSEKVIGLCEMLSRGGVVTKEDVLEIFFVEIGMIISGGLQEALTPEQPEGERAAFDMRQSIVERMACYLEGHRLAREQENKRGKGES